MQLGNSVYEKLRNFITLTQSPINPILPLNSLTDLQHFQHQPNATRDIKGIFTSVGMIHPSFY